jgi:hypothetical protein
MLSTPRPHLTSVRNKTGNSSGDDDDIQAEAREYSEDGVLGSIPKINQFCCSHLFLLILDRIFSPSDGIIMHFSIACARLFLNFLMVLQDSSFLFAEKHLFDSIRGLEMYSIRTKIRVSNKFKFCEIMRFVVDLWQFNSSFPRFRMYPATHLIADRTSRLSLSFSTPLTDEDHIQGFQYTTAISDRNSRLWERKKMEATLTRGFSSSPTFPLNLPKIKNVSASPSLGSDIRFAAVDFCHTCRLLLARLLAATLQPLSLPFVRVRLFIWEWATTTTAAVIAAVVLSAVRLLRMCADGFLRVPSPPPPPPTPRAPTPRRLSLPVLLLLSGSAWAPLCRAANDYGLHIPVIPRYNLSRIAAYILAIPLHHLVLFAQHCFLRLQITFP